MGRVTYTGGYSAHLGGIVGRLVNLSYITNCANYGPATYSGTQTNEVISIGGIVGMCAGDNSKIIQNCANYGTITYNGKSTDLHMGGIVGNAWNGYVQIENCVSSGRIVNSKEANISNYTGSLVGSNTQPATRVTIANSFWTSDVGYDNVCGYNETTVTVTDSSLKELTKETVDDLNEYAEKNSTWNKWLLNTNNSTIHFKVNDYKGFSTSNKFILLPDLAATGNSTFKGWFTDPGYSTPLTSYEVSEGMTLYGLYGEVVVTVTFDGNGGTPSQQSKDVLFNKAYGVLPEATRSGYAFAGWFTGKEEGEGERVTEDSTVSVGRDHTLYAQWTAKNYTITFNPKEGSVTQTTKNVAYDSKYGELPEPEKAGYSFVGWFTEANGGKKIESATTVNITEDQTLYAHWAINKYTITFNSNGGSYCEPITKNYNIPITFPKPNKTGHTFDCWCSDPELGNEYTETTMPAENLTLYAKWSINNYTITFIFNNGKENDVKVLSFNETIIYPENLTREGFIFNGWSPKPEEMPAENINITAQWIEVTPELVDIVFDKKDMKEEEIREIIKEYTQEEFTIEKIETDESTGGTRVIIKFVDVEAAQNFIETIEAASRAKTSILKVGYAHEPIMSLSTSLCPFYLFGIIF